jgi:hypothetical protein
MRRAFLSVVYARDRQSQGGAVQTTNHDDARSAQESTGASVTIARLLTTRHPAEVEHLVDSLATSCVVDEWTDLAHRQLVEALLLCLTADTIRQDSDAEDAICSVLTQIGVMHRVGNLMFEFVRYTELSPGDREIVGRYRAWLPTRYAPMEEGGRWSTA